MTSVPSTRALNVTHNETQRLDLLGWTELSEEVIEATEDVSAIKEPLFELVRNVLLLSHDEAVSGNTSQEAARVQLLGRIEQA